MELQTLNDLYIHELKDLFKRQSSSKFGPVVNESVFEA